MTTSFAAETIAFQAGAFFKELTAFYEKARSTIDRYSTFNEIKSAGWTQELADIIFKHTGMKMVLHKGEPAIISAPLKNTHIFYSSLLQSHPEIIERIRQNAAVVKSDSLATVDNATGRVGGYFSEVVNELYMPTEAFVNRGTLSPAEWAAITLHECGHAHTFFSYVLRLNTTNQVLSYLSTSRIEGGEQYRIAVKKLDNVLGATAEDIETIEKAHTDEETYVLLLALQDRKMRSELGVSLYDSVACEQLADQYATRQGAGRELVDGLEKLGGLSNSFWPSLIGFVKYSITIFVGGAGAVIVVLLILLEAFIVTKVGQTYDNHEWRPRRVANDLITQLKNQDLDVEQKKRLIADIEYIDSVAEKYPHYRTVGAMVAYAIFSSHRKQYKLEMLQKQLEAIASSRLAVSAAKIQTLVQ